ncbi:MAG TPA: hypothetical protein EYH29_02310 [Caldilineales bacterium]|nr:hypothetical protein [Caldilineales bacterium]
MHDSFFRKGAPEPLSCYTCGVHSSQHRRRRR